MCGITGFLSQSNEYATEALTAQAGQMADVLTHRGPDDSGVWCDVAVGIALGHRRLSVLDLSEQGHQPMLSHCGQYVLVYNGEIYNCIELRQQLEDSGVHFRGHSDTEVLLAAISCWGIETALNQLRGMFAFAVWNRKTGTLTLARDRIGIKPLYYGIVGRDFVFGSELKSFRKHPQFQNSINPTAVALLMRHGYIGAPYSIYENIRKLRPGERLTIQGSTVDHSQIGYSLDQCHIQSYWNLSEVIHQSQQHPFSGNFEDAVIRLQEILTESVQLRMLADVPVGAFLSGGIDSSLVAALMQRDLSRSIRTFTIGFTEHDYDEAPYAHRISEYLGTEHTELCVTPHEVQDVIPLLPEIYDEPFADMSQIPTYLVSKMARQHVTVSLSGDGGDELFGGYQRYFDYSNIWQKLQKIPARNWTSSMMQRGSDMFANLLPVQKIQHIAAAMKVESPEELYALLHRIWRTEEIMAIDLVDPSLELGFGSSWADLNLAKLKWMALDTQTYLPDDILTKVDRASMAVSLEVRVPLLDHHLVEFAWSLPTHYRYQEHQGKRILRELLGRLLPGDLFERPKTGFGIPIGEWLRGPLQEWADDLLSSAQLQRHGLLNEQRVHTCWQEHQSGHRNHQYYLWNILVFQQWYARNY